ncbi:Putative Holin-X, holin superfamily III [Actinacidiphila bryophytorum]|uniref:Holin-X, holin superfamily III n=2 Tax=Actinacidiphila bryophytorum TaxID=1436133 RepID=A0A9W4ME27_9ACTN|nr:Putative Holin-X, holin superfamily III [Actinacidiphila bryophytorum]
MTEDAMSAAHNGDSRSIGQLFAAATAEMSALVHDEIALAKAELRQDAKRAAFGSGAVVGAVALAFFSVPMLSFAAAYGLQALGLTLGWSFLIVFGGYVLLALLLGAFAYGRFKKVKKPERSIASAKETAAVLQKAKPHPRELADGTVPALRSGATEASRVLPTGDATAGAKM